MTVASQTSRVSYAGNASTTLFAVPFYFLENGHLRVVLRSSAGVETVQTITTNYTVTGAGNPAGGSITMLVAPPSGSTLVIVRNVPVTQETDYQANDPFPAESHERALDKLTMIAQQSADIENRSIKIPETETNLTQLPANADRAGKLAGFTNTGDVTVSNSSITQVDNVVTDFNNLMLSGAGGNAAAVVYNPAGSGAVATTVQAKLREVVSVYDFGAIGNGLADDTAAFQAAAATGQYVFVPKPLTSYKITSTVTGLFYSFAPIVISGSGTVNITTLTDASSTASGSSYLRDDDKSKLAGFIETGTLVMAALGDSTEAGVGGTSGSTYGECNNAYNPAYANMFFYSLLRSDPNFMSVSDLSLPYQPAGDPANFPLTAPFSSLPFDNTQLVVSTDRSMRFAISRGTIASQNTNKITIYYLERTNDNAARFRFTAKDASGLILAQETIDTYTSPITFGGVTTQNVGLRIASTTVTLNSSQRYVYCVIDNLDVIDRGSGVAADGTACILGVSYGTGLKFRNFAVSSTTLLDSSAANISRGVTTSERLAKAQAFGANTFIIGWGTNDSKTGVSTVSEFKQNYRNLIDSIRATKPQAIIIAATDPRGVVGSIYENNPAYNQAIREIAAEKQTSLLDVEKLFDALPANMYADNVHPSDAGYLAIAKTLERLSFGQPVLYARPVIRDQINPFTTIPGGTNTFTGSFVEIESFTINVPAWGVNGEVYADLTLAENSDIELSAIQITWEPFTGLDGTGVSFGASPLTEAVVSATAVSGVAVTQISARRRIVVGAGEPAASITFKLLARDLQTRVLNATSVFGYTSYYIPDRGNHIFNRQDYPAT